MYRPNFPPMSTDGLSQYTFQELQNIARFFADPREFLVMQVLHKEPSVTSDRNIVMVAIADGTDWNPGSGAGMYRYQNGSWTFVG